MEKLAGALLDRCQYFWGIGKAGKKLQKHGLKLYFKVEATVAGKGLGSTELVFSTPKPPARQVLFKGHLKLCGGVRPPHILQFLARPAIDWLRSVRQHF